MKEKSSKFGSRGVSGDRMREATWPTSVAIVLSLSEDAGKSCQLDKKRRDSVNWTRDQYSWSISKLREMDQSR